MAPAFLIDRSPDFNGQTFDGNEISDGSVIQSGGDVIAGHERPRVPEPARRDHVERLGEVPLNGITQDAPGAAFFGSQLSVFMRGTDNRIDVNQPTS